MRYLFLVYHRTHDDLPEYGNVGDTRNYPLIYLFKYLRKDNSWIKFKWVSLEEDENDPNKVIIWGKDYIKSRLDIDDFSTEKDFLVYLKQYNQYRSKRFADMPAIRISRKNYEQLEKQWEEICKNKPKYLIFREHDNGYVDILEKEELSNEDLLIAKRDDKIGRHYFNRRKMYYVFHQEKLTGAWRSAADNLFESDFALYDPVDEEGVDNIDNQSVSIFKKMKKIVNKVINFFYEKLFIKNFNTRYVFYFYDEKYYYREKLFSRNLPLNDLFEFLSDKTKDCLSSIEKDKNDPNKVVIWSEFRFKKFVVWSSRNPTESFAFDEEKSTQYSQYAMKRFAEMPAIRISRKNCEQLERQWEKIREDKPKCLIFREHFNGYVDILEKDELSSEDIAIMNREHKIYLNYSKRWNEYTKAYPEKRSSTWRSPADNEFESDFALYDPVDEQGID